MIQPIGYFYLWRELFGKPIWLNSTAEQKAILIALIGMANFNGKEWEWKGEKFKADKGQFVTSLDSIVENCGKGITIQNVRSALLRFEKLGFLTNESTKTGRLITIANWEVYQAKEEVPNKDTNKEVTKSQQRGNKEVTPREEIKNVNNVKKNIYSDFSSNPDLLQALNDFEKMRNLLKNGKMTDRARTMMLEELNKLADTDEKKIAILEQSILNNWKGVFPLKEPAKIIPKKIFNNFDSRPYNPDHGEEFIEKPTIIPDEEFEQFVAANRKSISQ
jgi:DNA replication protein DnaD